MSTVNKYDEWADSCRTERGETITTAGSRRQKRPNPKYANTPDKTVGRSEKRKNIRVDTCDNNESPTKHPRTTTSTLNVTDDAAALLLLYS